MLRLAFVLMLSTILQTAFAGNIDTLEIFSVSMQKNIRCLLLKPDTYSVHGDAYPVVYLLHGWSGNYASWLTDAPQIKDLVDRYQILVVCPDGGYDSWYLDSPVDSSVRYETHIAIEVVDYVDYYYNTRKEAAGRAISGLSMGGHGAMYLAARHPDRFGAAGSMAGGLNLTPFYKNNWDLEGVLGKPSKYQENWQRNSVLYYVPQFKENKQRLIIDCGVGDFFLPVNREMHQKLLEAGVPHDYTERPGEHNGEYWSGAVDFQLLFFKEGF